MWKIQGNENLKVTTHNKHCDRPKTSRECGILQEFVQGDISDERCTCEIKFRIVMLKVALNKVMKYFPANWTYI
jgi:hypothetical protein